MDYYVYEFTSNSRHVEKQGHWHKKQYIAVAYTKRPEKFQKNHQIPDDYYG